MGKDDPLCDRVSDETWQMCPGGHERSRGPSKRVKLKRDDRNNLDISCLEFRSKSDSMSKSSLEDLVFKRKKLDGDSKRGDCFSIESCDSEFVGRRKESDERGVGAIESRCLTPNLTTKDSKGSIDREGLVDSITHKGGVTKIVGVDSVNGSCASSKSNVDSTSKVELDEASESSSCSIIDMKHAGEDLTEKEFCINILRSYGLLGRHCETKPFEPPENSTSCVRKCNICRRSKISTKLLICDSCDEAFHMHCCKPRIRTAPCDDWFCHSCVKNGCKCLKEKFTRKFPSISGHKSLSPNGKTNSIALMLRKNEPYISSVRIGKAFQAEVPDWSGPLELNNYVVAEPLKIDASECLTFHEVTHNKTSQSKHLNNWLQCQAVLDASEDDLTNGTICGKWRKAPLLEVQTDDWECFCSISWDPAQSDCAVPQEVETAEVLRQLKCLEKLKPQLFAKWKYQGDTKSKGN